MQLYLMYSFYLHIHNNPALFYGTPLYDLAEALSGFQFFQDDKKMKNLLTKYQKSISIIIEIKYKFVQTFGFSLVILRFYYKQS